MASSGSLLIGDGRVVSIHYTLKDDGGEVIDRSEEGTPLEYLHGSGNIVPGLERGLLGLAVGSRVEVVVEAADGYGLRDDRRVQRVPRRAFPEDADLQPGMPFGARSPEGETFTLWVAEVEGDEVTVDMNHPLAGKTLHFDVTVAAVREASEDELAHGHPHGPGGHGHEHGN